jgi:putative phage-type endonuclease
MVIQGSKEWHILRKNHIGASDAPVIMNGVHFDKTRYMLWKEKLDLQFEEAAPTGAMQYGNRMEEPARRAYEAYTGNFVTPEVVFHPSRKFMMASLDGLTPNGDIAVELKNAGRQDHEVARSGRVPEHYYPQVQHQLACLGFNSLHYYSFNSGEGLLVEVERDEKFIERLYLEEGNFWEINVQGLVEPELTDRDFVRLTERDWTELAEGWGAVNRQMDELERKEKEYRAAMIAKAAGRNVWGGGVKLQTIVRKGNVDYKAIPELKGVNLDAYRKEPVSSWRITECR